MQPNNGMTSFNPHIFKAFYDWMLENHATPHLVVNADKPGVLVPREFVHQNLIVLSISPLATRDFSIESWGISFGARFHGQEMQVQVPYSAMRELYSVEHGVSYPLALWLMEDSAVQEYVEQFDEQKGAAEFVPVQPQTAAPAPAPAAESPKDEDSGPSFSILSDDSALDDSDNKGRPEEPHDPQQPQ